MYKQQNLFDYDTRMQRDSSLSIREKAETYGLSHLDNSELIALVTGMDLDEVKKAIEIYKGVKNTLAALDEKKSLKNLKAGAVLKLAQIAFTEEIEYTVLNSASKAGYYCMAKISHLPYEVFCVIFLDAQNRVLRFEEVAKGTVNESPVYPRQVLSIAIEKNSRCNSLILTHNHPGGSLQISEADLEVTRRIKTAANALDIRITDHIIVADNGYTSMLEKGLI